MFDLEKQVADQLTGTRRRRFDWLAENRQYVAYIIAEMACWGVHDLPALDRQLVLCEDAINALIEDPRLAAALSAEYAVRDAALLHPRGRPPEGLDCVVCRTGGYSIDDVLHRLPQPVG